MSKKRDFGGIIQKFSTIITVFLYIGEIIWFIYSIRNFIKYKDALDFIYLESEYTVLAQQGLYGILFSIVSAVITTMLFLMLYGFGQIVSDVHRLSKE